MTRPTDAEITALEAYISIPIDPTSYLALGGWYASTVKLLPRLIAGYRELECDFREENELRNQEAVQLEAAEDHLATVEAALQAMVDLEFDGEGGTDNNQCFYCGCYRGEQHENNCKWLRGRAALEPRA